MRRSVPWSAVLESGMVVHYAAYRVLYRDIDSMGVLYYGRYLALFEIGRVEWMRSEGCRYRDLEDQDQVILPVIEAKCSYLASIAYDDLAIIETQVDSWSGSTVRFSHRVFVANSELGPADSSGQALENLVSELQEGDLRATGRVELGCVRRSDHRPTRMPEDLRAMLQRCSPGAFRRRLGREQ